MLVLPPLIVKAYILDLVAVFLYILHLRHGGHLDVIPLKSIFFPFSNKYLRQE